MIYGYVNTKGETIKGGHPVVLALHLILSIFGKKYIWKLRDETQDVRGTRKGNILYLSKEL